MKNEDIPVEQLDDDENAQAFYWEHLGDKYEEHVPEEYWKQRHTPENVKTIRPLDPKKFGRIVLGNKNINYECVDGCPANNIDMERDCRVLGIYRIVNGQAYGKEPFNHGWDICHLIVLNKKRMYTLLFNKNSKEDQHDTEFWHWLDEKRGVNAKHEHRMLVDDFIEFLGEKHPELLRSSIPKHESWEEFKIGKKVE